MAVITVRIFNSGRLLDTRERPLRRTPDGRLGVAFEGAVFPLADGCTIDVGGPWFYPGECPVLLEPSSDLDPALALDIPFRWAYDRDGYYAYLFLDGSEGLKAAVTADLERAGFAVSRSGAGSASAGGEIYDWYLRLAAEGEAKPSPWEIAEVLSRAARQAADHAHFVPLRPPAEPDVGTMREQLAESQRRTSAAERRAIERENEAAAIRVELNRLREESSRALAERADQNALLRAALREYKFQFDGLSTRERDFASELERVNRELLAAAERAQKESHEAAAARADMDLAMANWLQADERRGLAERELARFKERLEDTERNVLKLQDTVDRYAAKVGERRRAARREEFAATLATLLPRLQFVAGSIEFIAEEVFDRRDLFNDLRTLHDAPASVASKKVAGTDGWLERHFSTGQSNDGRIYFRKRQDGRYDVLASDKAAQQRDIERLRRL